MMIFIFCNVGMNFTTIIIDNLVSSLMVDDMIETDPLKQHGKPSHKLDASIIPKSTLSKPISKKKGLEVAKPLEKPLRHKKKAIILIWLLMKLRMKPYSYYIQTHVVWMM